MVSQNLNGAGVRLKKRSVSKTEQMLLVCPRKPTLRDFLTTRYERNSVDWVIALRHFFLVASTIALAIRSAFSRKSSISFQAFSWVMGRSNLQYSALAVCACALQFNIDVTPTTLPFAGLRGRARGPWGGGTVGLIVGLPMLARAADAQSARALPVPR